MEAQVRYHSRKYALQNRWDPRHLTTVKRLLPMQPGDRVLELGCGRGHLTKRLQEMGLEATGVDANAEAVATGVTGGLRCMNALDLDFPDADFDALVSFHMIEHIPDLRSALAEMYRVVRPGGRFLLVYPAEVFRGAYAWPGSIILHGTPFKAREIHVHRLNPKKLQALTDQIGFEHLSSEFQFRFTPQHATVLGRPAA